MRKCNTSPVLTLPAYVWDFLYSDYVDTFRRVGMIRNTREDSNGEPVYLPTKFGLTFMNAHRHDFEEELDAAMERLKRAH